MSVQVSYPGVYIEEFTPAAPIEGVSTSTAAFLGIAEKGPRKTPSLIQSWDKFQETFGGFMTGVPNAWLAPAVFGFFQNGGSAVYVVRASTASNSNVDIPSRTGGTTALVATAVPEGPAGDTIKIDITDASRVDDATANVTRQQVTAVSANRRTLTVATGTKFPDASYVTVVASDGTKESRRVTSTTATTVVFTTGLPNSPGFTNGFVTPAVVVAAAASAAISLMNTRTTLTMANDQHGLRAGDSVVAKKDAHETSVTIQSVNGTSITLTGPLGGADNYTGGTLTLIDLKPGGRRLRVVMPPNVALNQALPTGSLLSISNGGSSEFVKVAAAGGDVIALDGPGLVNTYPLDDPEAPPVITSAEFNLLITDQAGGKVESYGGLSMDVRHPSYWGTAVTSSIVDLSLPDPPGVPQPDPRPTANSYPLANGVADNPTQSWNDLVGSPDSYFALLAKRQDISIVAIPGATGQTIQSALKDHCESLYDRFAILDSQKGADIEAVTTQFAGVRSSKGFAALYYPWITVANPANGAIELWPPSGHLAGVYARTDQTRGVHKAPANTNIRGALGIETLLTNAEQGPINLMGINALRVFPGQSQPMVWGARTTAGDLDRNWQYVNIRRLFTYLELSIERGIRGAVFEPNDLLLWGKLKRTITNFLVRVWKDGALFGATPEDAFYVRIDEVLNPPSSRALGRLYIEIGVVPTYPAEFIILRIGIWDGGAEITES